jgi:hypothetical protein
MVKLREIIYLTDFEESIFSGQNAKIRAFCGGRNKKSAPFTVPPLTILARYGIFTG